MCQPLCPAARRELIVDLLRPRSPVNIEQHWITLIRIERDGLDDAAVDVQITGDAPFETGLLDSPGQPAPTVPGTP